MGNSKLAGSNLLISPVSLLTCFCFVLHQIDKQLDAVFSKGKPHIKKAAPVGGEQIKGEQQGKNQWLISASCFGNLSKFQGAGLNLRWTGIQPMEEEP